MKIENSHGLNLMKRILDEARNVKKFHYVSECRLPPSSKNLDEFYI